MIRRYKEASTGPKALSDLQKAHALARAFIDEARINRTTALEEGSIARFTEEDLQPVEDNLLASEAWLRELSQKQKQLTKRQDPVLKTDDMQKRGMELQKLVKGLQKKRPLRTPKPSMSSSSSSTAESTPTASHGEHDSVHNRDEL